MASHRRVLSLGLGIASVALLAPTALAQKTYENTTHGFKLKVPGIFVEQPLEPLERQILAKWVGKADFKYEGLRSEDYQYQLLVVRIVKEGPTTGEQPDGEDKEEERPTSIADSKAKHLNGGTRDPEAPRADERGTRMNRLEEA